MVNLCMGAWAMVATHMKCSIERETGDSYRESVTKFLLT